MAIEIPPAAKDAIDRWVSSAYPLSGFYHALLSGNIVAAAVSADQTNKAALADLILYCHWEIPSECWGSQQALNAWSEKIQARNAHAES